MSILEIIYNDFVDHIRNTYDRFRNFDDVNFLLEPLKEIKLQEGYVLDAYKVMDTYYRDGEYFMQLYTCKEGSTTEFRPKRVGVISKLVRKIFHQKSDCEYTPIYDNSMYISRPIPIALMECITCENLIVPFTEKGIWEALMLKIAYMHLPQFGHGCYKSSKLIIDTDGLENVIELYKIAKIENCVLIQGDAAIVKYTYWNEWQGIVKITIKANRVGDSIKWEKYFQKEIINSQKSSTRF